MPVIPGRSSAEPTFATQAADTVVSSGRRTSSIFMPLSSSTSTTGTLAGSCATAGAIAREGEREAQAQAHALLCFMVSSLGWRHGRDGVAAPEPPKKRV